ncbi:MAG: hypothetical protein WBM14_08220 [Terracidiphilus sp.]
MNTSIKNNVQETRIIRGLAVVAAFGALCFFLMIATGNFGQLQWTANPAQK